MERAAESLFHRIRYTPLRDALRGRLTARLDVARRIAAADVPVAAKELILRVVRRTGLRSWEKIEVADELIAHFADGLAGGASIEELLERFGNERTAAKLIGRAKRRGRSPWTWAAIAARWTPLLLALLYAAVAVHFFSGRPAASTPSEAMPGAATAMTQADAQHAMPLYLEAWDRLGGRLPGWQLQRRYPPSFFIGLSDPLEFEQHVDQRAATIELLRQAAQRPALGTTPPDARTLAVLRHLAWLLGRDALVAAARDDRDRLMRDLHAILGMSRHARFGGEGDLSAELTASTLLDEVSIVLRYVLEKHPAVLSDEDLQALAHLLAPPKTPADLLTFAGVRLRFHDALSRAYTDDGAGDGRLTPEGVSLLSQSGDARQEALRTPPLAPAAMLMAASRRELLAEFDRAMDAIRDHLRQPRRATDWSALEARLDGLRAARTRYPLLGEHLPHLPRMLHERVEGVLARRDGVLVGIALELFRRRHGQYPATLSALSPAFLPSIPPDRMTGELLRYRLVDGNPIVYSVSFDRDDDGGRDVPWLGSSWESRPADEDDVLFGAPSSTQPTTRDAPRRWGGTTPTSKTPANTPAPASRPLPSR